MPVNADLVNSTFYGAPGLVIDILGDLNTDLYGLSTCSLTATCPQNRYDLIPAMFSFHPVFTWLHVERQRVRIQEGRLNITCEYAGIIGGQTEPIYELSLGLSEEPIQTHPNFTVNATGGGDGQPIAGTPSEPKHGAIFKDDRGRITTNDATGNFVEFRSQLGVGVPNPFAGIVSYLDFGSATWRKRWYSVSRPTDITYLGHIQYPEGPAPGLGGLRNWLYVGLNYEQRGLVYGITKEWKASGRLPWNPNIYT